MRHPPHVVILAGGRGERFWPFSRRARPKPFLALDGRVTLLEAAWSRATSIAPPRNVWVVVSKSLTAPVRKALPRLVASRLVVEPEPRDTAAAIILAAERISAVDPDAVIVMQPSDHAIDRPAAWARDVRRAVALARRAGIVSLGVAPRGPETGFGYLVLDREPDGKGARVVRFVEKPKVARARALLRTGRCLWNSGAFACRVKGLLDEALRQRPDIVSAARSALAGDVGAWRRLTPISIDYAVLEGARDIRAIPLTSGWDDLGSWDVAARRQRGAPPDGTILLDSPGSAAFGGGRLIAILGVPGVVVADTPDALLVVARSRAQEVRRVVAALRERRRGDLE